MRDVAAGDELTHDWATTDDLDYEMICNWRDHGTRLDEARDTGEVSRVIRLVPAARDRRGERRDRLADAILGDSLFVEFDAEARLLRDV